MKKLILALGLASTLALVGCASSGPSPTAKPAGFLPDYSLLQEVTPSPKDMKIYDYVAPGVKRSDYNAVIVAPVMLYQTANKNGITVEEISAAQVSLQAGIQDIVSKKITVTTDRGPGVALLNVAITGAQIDNDGFKPRNLIPISAAIKLASMATGLNGKTPSMVVELKFTDSLSGKLLRETLTTISGEEFRQANTSAEFQQLAQTWVQEALKYTNAQS